MRSIYDQEMRDIQRDSIHMCNLASETLQDVMDAVRRRDFTVVERVLEQDQRIRSMRMALNERVMRMIATQHPVAVDLRRLFYIIHLADEMERIGYQAAAIGRCILRTQYGKVLLLEDIYRMSERTATMFERMLASSLNESTDAVRNVLTMDEREKPACRRGMRPKKRRLSRGSSSGLSRSSAGMSAGLPKQLLSRGKTALTSVIHEKLTQYQPMP